MPKYDLRCTACNSEHQVWASISEKSEKRIPCPECGSFELETLFKAPPAFVKGVGTGVAPCPQRSSCGANCPHAG